MMNRLEPAVIDSMKGMRNPEVVRYGLMAFIGSHMFRFTHWIFDSGGATCKSRTRRLRAGRHPGSHRGCLLCVGNVGYAQNCGYRHTASATIAPSLVFPSFVSCRTAMDHARRVSWILDSIDAVAVFAHHFLKVAGTAKYGWIIGEGVREINKWPSSHTLVVAGCRNFRPMALAEFASRHPDVTLTVVAAEGRKGNSS